MAFAAYSDVATRLGRTLTTSEQTLATAVIATVEGLIAEACGRASTWPSTVSPVPAALKELCISKAIAALANPSLGAVASESLGEHSVTFARSTDSGVFLTDDEERKARRAVFKRNVGSPRVGSVLDDLYNYGS